MKTYKNILVALGVTLFLLTVGVKSEAEAQPPTECDSDTCYQSQSWTLGVYKDTLGPQPACNDCWVEVHYSSRNNSTNPACQTLPPTEYRLDYVIVSGSCYYAPCAIFPQFSMEEAFRQVMIAWLVALGYPPVYPSDCGPVLKSFSIVSCFREDFDLDSNKILRVCNSYSCCKQDIQLFIENGQVVVKSIKTANTEDCDSDPNYPDDCKTICNWIDDAIVPKRVIENNSKPFNNPLTVSPNPLMGELLTFEFNLTEKIERISVISPDGRNVIIDKDRLLNTNVISLKDFSNGSYILVIKTESNNLYYSNFIKVN